MAKSSRKQPLYDQLVDVIKDRIENELLAGDLLPSERELSERYGLSRTTVRLALAQLESMGLVVRRHGKGTFVAEAHEEPTNLLGAYSFTDQMREMGRTPRTETLKFEIVEAPKHVAEHLGVRLGERVYRIRRLRIADDIPMMLERTYLPVSQFVGLTRADLDERPLYEIIENDYRDVIKVADEEFRASLARREEAELLGIQEGAPVLKLVRTTYDEKNLIIEYTHSVARADQFIYKVSHHRG